MTSATITTETAIERAPCRWYRLRSCASLTLRPYTSRMSGACVRLRWRSASGQVLPSRNDMLTAAEAEQLGMALIVAADRARAAEAAVAHDTADRAALATVRDWNVPKPAPGHGALDIDWSAPEPVRSRTRPDRIETPWGEIWMRTTDGLYRSPAGASLSYGALDDRIDRFHGRWATLRAGVHYRIHGARLAVLRRNADHTTYRSGHCAATGQPGGLWLVEQSTVGRARWEIENWWMTGPRPAPVALTLDQIVERIDPRR